MSWRKNLGAVHSSAVEGDVTQLFRDNDTGSYRLFVYKGWRDVHPGNTSERCECCDLSIEDMRGLAVILEEAIRKHEPWPPAEDCE